MSLHHGRLAKLIPVSVDHFLHRVRSIGREAGVATTGKQLQLFVVICKVIKFSPGRQTDC